MNPEYLSECYVLAYNKAFEMTRNPNIAVGAAMSVVNSIANSMKQNQESNDMFTMLMNAMVMNAKKTNKKTYTKKKDGEEQ